MRYEKAAANMRSDDQLRALRVERARSKRKAPISESQVIAFKSLQADFIARVRAIQAEVD